MKYHNDQKKEEEMTISINESNLKGSETNAMKKIERRNKL